MSFRTQPRFHLAITPANDPSAYAARPTVLTGARVAIAKGAEAGAEHSRRRCSGFCAARCLWPRPHRAVGPHSWRA